MTDSAEIVRRLRELAESPHDVAGAQDDIRAAAAHIEALEARAERAENVFAKARTVLDMRRWGFGRFQYLDSRDKECEALEALAQALPDPPAQPKKSEGG